LVEWMLSCKTGIIYGNICLEYRTTISWHYRITVFTHQYCPREERSLLSPLETPGIWLQKGGRYPSGWEQCTTMVRHSARILFSFLACLAFSLAKKYYKISYLGLCLLSYSYIISICQS
jgi:hypothetical protein